MLSLVGVGLRNDEGPEFVAVGEDTVVANEIEAWGRDEGGEAGEEGVAGDDGEGGPVASGLLEAQAEQIDKVLAIARERMKERGQVLSRSSESPTA